MGFAPEPVAATIRIRGQVQGVGFRPFVCRLARELGIVGRVSNDAEGVLIRAEGPPRDLAGFRQALRTAAPPAARIESVSVEPAPASGFESFEVDASGPSSRPLARVPRDLATCAACLRELAGPAERRFGYPFTSCTDCGPRYSIIEHLPYDRGRTAMRSFLMCGPCRAEFDLPTDRRFHAEPIACGACGPRVAFRHRDGSEVTFGPDAIRAAAVAIRDGQIVAMKGLGGFQLLARADHPGPIARLRERKDRPTKPLAVMVASPEAAERLAAVGPQERHWLTSPENPIVLLDRPRPDGASISGGITPEVAPRVSTLGVLLPTTPLHHLLLAGLDGPVVATSGNRGDEPTVTDEAEAPTELSGIADAFLVHDRPIVRRVDDSVVRVIAGRPVALRLARGYAPLPLPAVERLAGAPASGGDALPPLLATGGHQKVAPALWSGCQAALGPHVGDMDGVQAREAFERLAASLGELYGYTPAVLACDLHPGYFTSRWATARGPAVVRVQHHHAHAVAAMIEHDFLDREVLAVTWDGTGYGPDGTVWGGEILRAGVHSFDRVASLLPFPLPGGEAAIRHPGRAALGVLAVTLGVEGVLRDPALLGRLGLSRREAETLLMMIGRGVNTPWTSSVGRLFDAVAALVLGVGTVSHEGEAAGWLEAVADPGRSDAYALVPGVPSGPGPGAGDPAIPRGDWRPMIAGILADLGRGIEAGVIAARFHEALARWAAAVVAGQPRREVVLGGGCFQNRRLAVATLEAIRAAGARAHGPGLIPPGDGGLAAGQLAVALARLRRGRSST